MGSLVASGLLKTAVDRLNPAVTLRTELNTQGGPHLGDAPGTYSILLRCGALSASNDRF